MSDSSSVFCESFIFSIDSCFTLAHGSPKDKKSFKKSPANKVILFIALEPNIGIVGPQEKLRECPGLCVVLPNNKEPKRFVGDQCMRIEEGIIWPRFVGSSFSRSVDFILFIAYTLTA